MEDRVVLERKVELTDLEGREHGFPEMKIRVSTSESNCAGPDADAVDREVSTNDQLTLFEPTSLGYRQTWQHFLERRAPASHQRAGAILLLLAVAAEARETFVVPGDVVVRHRDRAEADEEIHVAGGLREDEVGDISEREACRAAIVEAHEVELLRATEPDREGVRIIRRNRGKREDRSESEPLEVASGLYWSSVTKSLYMQDVWMGLIKPFVLGFIIVTIACHVGLRTSGGTQGVGKATTLAVVAGSVAVIAADFFVTQILIFTIYPH